MSDRTEDLWGEGGVFDQLSDALNLVPQATFDRYAESARINAALWTRTVEGRRTEIIDQTVADLAIIGQASDRVHSLCCAQGCVRREDTKPEGD